mgnify:CR=1 FL=1
MLACAEKAGLLLFTGGVVIFFVSYSKKKKKEREKKGKVRLSVPKERIAGLLNKRILK